MRADDFITEDIDLNAQYWRGKVLTKKHPRLDRIESKEAWRLAHNEEDKEFHALVLKFYEEIRQQQMTLDAKETAQRLADIRRKAQNPTRNTQKR